MTAHQLAALLLQCSNVEVVTCPAVQAIDFIEECGRDIKDPYVVLHSACDFPQGH